MGIHFLNAGTMGSVAGSGDRITNGPHAMVPGRVYVGDILGEIPKGSAR